MIILPTKGRPHNLRRFISAYVKTRATLPVLVALDGADIASYTEFFNSLYEPIPQQFSFIIMPAGTPIGDIFNIISSKFCNEPFYGVMADDVVPETEFWDVVLRDACVPDKISWGSDGIQNARLATHPFIGGDLVRKLGWMAPPGVKHWYVDNGWTQLAKLADAGAYLPEVKTTHMHPVRDKAPMDETYLKQPDHMRDHDAFVEFMRNEMPGALERIKNN